jgi:trimeric autotransporter adhesin
MYSFNLYNTNKCINFVNKSFDVCYTTDSSNNIIYNVKSKKIKNIQSILDKKKCLLNDIPLCCRTDTIPNIIPVGSLPFVMEFKYIGFVEFNSLLFFENYVPITNIDGGFSNISFKLIPNEPIFNDIVLLEIYFSKPFIDNIAETRISGFTFNSNINSINWWNNNTTNIKIINWNDLNLSRKGSQFKNLQVPLIIETNDTPLILNNTSFESIFYNCINFNSNISNWNINNNITDFTSAFENAINFNNGGFYNPLLWNTESVNFVDFMFKNALVFNQSISNWKFPLITSCIEMFKNAINFNNGNITNLATNTFNFEANNLTNLTSMFENARSFNQNITNWNVINVEFFTNMFKDAIKFNNGDINNIRTKPLNWKIKTQELYKSNFTQAVNSDLIKFNINLLDSDTWPTPSSQEWNSLNEYTQIFLTQASTPSGTLNPNNVQVSLYAKIEFVSMFQNAIKYNQSMINDITGNRYWDLQYLLGNDPNLLITLGTYIVNPNRFDNMFFNASIFNNGDFLNSQSKNMYWFGNIAPIKPVNNNIIPQPVSGKIPNYFSTNSALTLTQQDTFIPIIGNSIFAIANEGDPYFVNYTPEPFSSFIPLGDGVRTTAFGQQQPTVYSLSNFSNIDLYVGGTFIEAGDQSFVNNIAKYDTNIDSWSSLTTGVQPLVGSFVYAVTIIDNNIYVGGKFNNAGGINVNNIAKYDIDTNTWSSLGNGVNNEVYTLTSFNNNLYVGGTFTIIGNNINANYIAKYDINTNTWSSLGNGVNDFVQTLIVVSNNLYIGGFFTIANNTINANKIVKYDILNDIWYPLGNGLNNGVIFSFALIDSDLYIGGSFTGVGNNLTSNNIAKYNTTINPPSNLGWSSITNGTNNNIYSLNTKNELLFIGGQFSLANNVFSQNIVFYNTITEQWSILSNELDGAIISIININNFLYIGGSFQFNNIVKYEIPDPDDANYIPLGDGINNGFGGFPPSVRTLSIYNSPLLFVGGSFGQAGNKTAFNISNYSIENQPPSNEGWSILGTNNSNNGTNNIIYSSKVIGNFIYIGGDFSRVNTSTSSGGTAASRIARYNINTNVWSELGTGLNNDVLVLANINNILFVGGIFTNANGTTRNRITRYNTETNSWGNGLGDGINGICRALVTNGNDLYVGGSFSRVATGTTGGIIAPGLAKYDTTKTDNTGWSSLINNIDGTIYTLAIINDNLYVGGDFIEIEGIIVNGIAKYDIINNIWSSLGSGVSAENEFEFYVVYTLHVIDNDLYVGGIFKNAGNIIVNNIAKYDTTKTDNSGWSRLGNGIRSSEFFPEPTIYSLTSYNNKLYIGGSFIDRGNNIVQYNIV